MKNPVTYAVVHEYAPDYSYVEAVERDAWETMAELIEDHIANLECRGCGRYTEDKRHGFHIFVQHNGYRIAELGS